MSLQGIFNDAAAKLPSIPAVKMRCNSDHRTEGELWSAISIPIVHHVFMEHAAPVPNLLEIPIAAHRVGTKSNNREHLDNQPVTWLMIDSESGFAPMGWQQGVGTVIVARRDQKPLLVQHLECLHDYNGAILKYFGEGEGPPKHMFSRQAFEKYWAEYKARRADEPGWKDVKSPYEV